MSVCVCVQVQPCEPERKKDKEVATVSSETCTVVCSCVSVCMRAPCEPEKKDEHSFFFWNTRWWLAHRQCAV